MKNKPKSFLEYRNGLDEIMPLPVTVENSYYFACVRVLFDIVFSPEAQENFEYRMHKPSRSYMICSELCCIFLAFASVSSVMSFWAIPRLFAIALRKIRRPTYYDRENERRHKLAKDRIKVRRRYTINNVPTAEQLLRQYAKVKKSPVDMLVFGSMLEDLEAYVDNSVVRDENGHIVGRRGGIKQWMWQNCPEFALHYSTIMRYKAMAKRFKQVIEMQDPIPVTYALGVSTENEVVIAGNDRGKAGSDNKIFRCGLKYENLGMNSDFAMSSEGEERMRRVCEERVKRFLADECREKYKRAAADFMKGCMGTQRSLEYELALKVDPDKVPREYLKMKENSITVRTVMLA